MNMLVKSWPGRCMRKSDTEKKEALCEVTAANGRMKVIFAEEQEAITPGQSVVFYETTLF